jgi:glycosyltransferase involved in cell wall biosynthesis
MKASRKRIAIVAYSAPPYSAGGVASAHFNLFQGLKKRKQFEVRFFTFGDTGRRSTRELVRAGSPRWFTKLVGAFNGVFFALFSPGKPGYQAFDVISSQWGARRMGAEMEKFNPHVVILSDHGAPALAMRKPAGSKWILISHHNPARFVANQELAATHSVLDAKLAVWFEQRSLSKIDLVVCPSAYMKTWFVKTYEFNKRILVIPNLLDSKTVDAITAKSPRKKLRLRKKTQLIYMPSAGSPLKGGHYLTRIVAGLAGSGQPLAFYIPGPITDELKETSRRFNGSASFFMPGQLSYHRHIAYMKSCSFGISPSLMENYSMALLEAVYSGVPMITFDTGGNSEIIRDGKNGYLTPVGDIPAVVKHGRALLKPKTLKRIKKQAARYSRTELSPSKPLKEYAELVSSL